MNSTDSSILPNSQSLNVDIVEINKLLLLLPEEIALQTRQHLEQVLRDRLPPPPAQSPIIVKEAPCDRCGLVRSVSNMSRHQESPKCKNSTLTSSPKTIIITPKSKLLVANITNKVLSQINSLICDILIMTTKEFRGDKYRIFCETWGNPHLGGLTVPMSFQNIIVSGMKKKDMVSACLFKVSEVLPQFHRGLVEYLTKVGSVSREELVKLYNIVDPQRESFIAELYTWEMKETVVDKAISNWFQNIDEEEVDDSVDEEEGGVDEEEGGVDEEEEGLSESVATLQIDVEDTTGS
jgi:hypothetical protein